MKKALLIIHLLFALSLQTTYGQIIASTKSHTITSKKIIGSDLLVPIELEFVNPTAKEVNTTISVEIDNNTAPVISQFDETDLREIRIINEIQTLSINAFETKEVQNAFYLFIGRNVFINYDKIVYLKVKDGVHEITTFKATIQPEDKILSLSDYLEKKKKPNERIYRLNDVTKVESSDNILTISGYKEMRVNDSTKQDVFLKRKVELERRKVLAIIEHSWILQPIHWKPVPMSLTTIPFKVRQKTTSNGKEFSSTATSGITNLGFNLDLFKRQTDRYFATGKKSSHIWSLGFWTAPSVEELDSVFTFGANGALGKDAGKMEKSKQLFISTGLTISYTYNDISFVFVPAGWDFGTTSIGKSWVYNRERWWGFGLAISPKIFATALNK